jgi:hypothetical protein
MHHTSEKMVFHQHEAGHCPAFSLVPNACMFPLFVKLRSLLVRSDYRLRIVNYPSGFNQTAKTEITLL